MNKQIVSFGECNNRIYTSNKTAMTVRAECHGAIPIVCMDNQTNGIPEEHRGSVVCTKAYNESGKGYWTEGVGCLRAQETNGIGAHIICFQLSGDRDNPSVSANNKNAYCLPANPMSDRGQAVCYAIDHVITTGGNCTAQGPCYYMELCPTQKAAGVHSVCYQKEKMNEEY